MYISMFGLKNLGNSCYLNAVIQALYSVSSIQENLRANPDFTDLCLDHNPQKILNLIVRHGLTRGRQEDALECFKILLDVLSAAVIFQTRYILSIFCRCGSQQTVNSYPPEVFINVSGAPQTETGIQNYVLSHMLLPDDYKCESCGRKNTPEAHIYQKYTLARVSKALVLSWNAKKNDQKYFPPVIRIPMANKTFSDFHLVAHIQHFGTMNSGHYTCQCVRQKFDTRIIVNCDDTLVHQIGNIVPTPNTYMAFYELDIKVWPASPAQ